MEKRKKKKTVGRDDCILMALVAAVAGGVAGLTGYKDRTIINWIMEDLSAVVLVFAMFGIVALVTSAFMQKSYDWDGKRMWIWRLIALCLALNFVFLACGWRFKRAWIKGQEATKSEIYQEAYEDGYHDAISGLEQSEGWE